MPVRIEARDGMQIGFGVMQLLNLVPDCAIISTWGARAPLDSNAPKQSPRCMSEVINKIFGFDSDMRDFLNDLETSCCKMLEAVMVYVNLNFR
jgi:hypothetical protein